MISPAAHLASRVLARLAVLIARRRRWFIYPQLLLAALCVAYTIRYLEFDMTRDNLVGGDKKYHQNFLKFRKEFPLQDEIVVVVESENQEKNRQFVERLGARLETATNLFSDVVYKGDLKLLGPKALLFVPEPSLRELLQTLENSRPFIQQFSRAASLESLLALVNNQFLNARREDNAENRAMADALPALERILLQAASSLKRGGNPPSPGIEALFNGGEEAENEMYVTFARGRIYLVTARALSSDLAGDAIGHLRKLIEVTQKEVPGVNVGVTGEPVLEIDEMLQSQQDTSLATAISLVLVALVFIYGYHSTGRPLKATFCLLIGLAYTMAFTTATVGHLNILTITFAPILIGLAIDFGIHLISRYEEEIRHGKSEAEALEKALVYTGLGITTGCLTTAGAFLAMFVTNFKGIQEMGIICGGGLLLSLVPMMTMLPALLLTGRQNIIDHALGVALERRERIERLWLGRPRMVLAITIAASLAAAYAARTVYFDYNLLNMQSKGLPAVEYEQVLINSANKSVLFGASLADSFHEALILERRFRALPSVASADLGGIDNLSTYLTEDQTGKLALVKQIRQVARAIPLPPPDAPPANPRELSRQLWTLYGFLTLAVASVQDEDPQLRARLISLRDAVSELRAQMLAFESNYVSTQLTAFQQALFRDLRSTFEAMQNQDAESRLTASDLPETLRKRFLGVSGKYLVQVYPRKDVWQRENQREFVHELRQVDENVTGTPVQLLEYTTLLKNSYERAALYSLIAISLLVFIHFRSLRSVALALLPVGMGTLWMTGLMGLLGIPFNPANIMTLPLVIGVGVTNGIHILNRYAEEGRPSILAKSTGKAVLVSGLTTIAGFGSLILAKHQGISSLGLVMAVGTATCMFAGLTVLPAILNLGGGFLWREKRTQG